jgi:uncharacterized metal-binding protein
MASHPEEDLREGLGRKCDEELCPFCRREAWVSIGDSFYLKTDEVSPPGVIHIPEHGIPVYGLVCRNCGFLRMHVATTLARASRQPG